MTSVRSARGVRIEAGECALTLYAYAEQRPAGPPPPYIVCSGCGASICISCVEACCVCLEGVLREKKQYRIAQSASHHELWGRYLARPWRSPSSHPDLVKVVKPGQEVYRMVGDACALLARIVEERPSRPRHYQAPGCCSPIPGDPAARRALGRLRSCQCSVGSRARRREWHGYPHHRLRYSYAKNRPPGYFLPHRCVRQRIEPPPPPPPCPRASARQTQGHWRACRHVHYGALALLPPCTVAFSAARCPSRQPIAQPRALLTCALPAWPGCLSSRALLQRAGQLSSWEKRAS